VGRLRLLVSRESVRVDGNGISQTEMVSTTDLGYYVRERDDSPLLSRNARNLVMVKVGSQPAREPHRQAKLGPAKAKKTVHKEISVGGKEVAVEEK